MNTLYRKQFTFLILLILIVPMLLFANLAWFTYNTNHTIDAQNQETARLLTSSMSPSLSGLFNDPSKLKVELAAIQKRNAAISEITLYKFTNDTFASIASTNDQNELQVIQNASANQAWQDDTTQITTEGAANANKSWTGTTTLHDTDGNKIGLMRLKFVSTPYDKSVTDSYFQAFVAVIFATILFYAVIVGYFISMRYVSRIIKMHRESYKSDSLISEAASGFQLPIATINKNYNSIVEKGYDQLFDEKGEDALRGIYNHSANLAYMVRDLLELNQIMQKETTLQPVPLNLILICQQLEKELQHVAKNRNAHIVHTPPESSKLVIADEHWISRVLHTIISLALQRMKEGSVTISYEFPDAEHTVVIISSNSYNVHDQTATLERDNGEMTETDYFSHLGVSYWVAEKIMHQMGGELQSKFQLVQGVVFRVSIPNASTTQPS